MEANGRRTKIFAIQLFQQAQVPSSGQRWHVVSLTLNVFFLARRGDVHCPWAMIGVYNCVACNHKAKVKEEIVGRARLFDVG